MKIKQFLREAFFTAAKAKGTVMEVFKNPTPREMKDASMVVGGKRDIRFLADSKGKKIYVWRPDFLHYSAWNFIRKEKKGKDTRLVNDSTLFTGIARFIDGGWHIIDVGVMENPKKFRWTMKWFANFEDAMYN
jgi:hypothetical protein